MQKLLIVILLTSFTAIAKGADFYPSFLIQLNEKFSQYTILVEKSTHRLFIYENSQSIPKLVKEFKIATGKITGNKFIEGDHRTPEGIYFVQKFHSQNDLEQKYGQETSKIYGIGAFTLNYPNLFDRRQGKTGGGIWLHSTDDDKRVNLGLDSRGCVVAKEKDLKEIANFLDLGVTPVIITEAISYLDNESWKIERDKLSNTFNQWTRAWKEKRFQDYIGFYHPQNFSDPRRGKFAGFRQYKKAVFSRKDQPNITFRNTSIFRFKKQAIVIAEQDYRSEVITDIGKKTLYLEQDENYNWKIVAEHWSRIDNEVPELAMNQKNYFNAKESKTN